MFGRRKQPEYMDEPLELDEIPGAFEPEIPLGENIFESAVPAGPPPRELRLPRRGRLIPLRLKLGVVALVTLAAGTALAASPPPETPQDARPRAAATPRAAKQAPPRATAERKPRVEKRTHRRRPEPKPKPKPRKPQRQRPRPVVAAAPAPAPAVTPAATPAPPAPTAPSRPAPPSDEFGIEQ